MKNTRIIKTSAKQIFSSFEGAAIQMEFLSCRWAPGTVGKSRRGLSPSVTLSSGGSKQLVLGCLWCFSPKVSRGNETGVDRTWGFSVKDLDGWGGNVF